MTQSSLTQSNASDHCIRSILADGFFIHSPTRFANSVGTLYRLVRDHGAWRKLGHQYKDLEKAALNGISNGLGAVLILLAVGALVGTWISGGIVPTIIYYGLKAIHPSIFLLATMVICSLTALATGTSWGAAGTAGIAMMGIGQV